MNLFIIILSLYLFSGIYATNTTTSFGIDVLKTLKNKKISCNFHDFVKSADDSNDDYDALMDDLTKYCKASKSTKQYRVLCHMLLIEFQIGCLLSNESRPYPIIYNTSLTPTQICSMNRISYTNSWIWVKLTSYERDQIGSMTSQLCPRLVAYNETLRLVRFFYKIAPRIRRADTTNVTSKANKVSQELSVDKIPSKVVTNKTDVETSAQKDRLSEDKLADFGGLPRRDRRDPKIIKTRAKVPAVLDLKNNRSKSRINKFKKKIDVQEKNDDDANDGGDGNIVYSNDDKANFNVQQNKPDDVDLKQDKQEEKAVIQKTSTTKASRLVDSRIKREGSPLGRAGEKPEHEQVNERPKPKALDVESVFKDIHPKELRNWVEGKNEEKPLEGAVVANINRFHRLKLEENPSANAQIPRKKPSLRSRLSKYTANRGSWSNNIVTTLLIFTLSIVVIYLILNNRNKVLGLIIEGCKRNRVFHSPRFDSAFGTRRHTRLSQSS